MADKYSVRWSQQLPSGAHILRTFNISILAPPHEPTKFACHVTIEHLTTNYEVLLQGVYDEQVPVHTKG